MFNKDKFKTMVKQMVQKFILKHNINLLDDLNTTEIGEQRIFWQKELTWWKETNKKYELEVNQWAECYRETKDLEYHRRKIKAQKKVAIGEQGIDMCLTKLNLELDPAYKEMLKEFSEELTENKFELFMKHLRFDLQRILLRRFIEHITVDNNGSLDVTWKKLEDITS
jgi:hypothetical protein